MQWLMRIFTKDNGLQRRLIDVLNKRVMELETRVQLVTGKENTVTHLLEENERLRRDNAMLMEECERVKRWNTTVIQRDRDSSSELAALKYRFSTFMRDYDAVRNNVVGAERAAEFALRMLKECRRDHEVLRRRLTEKNAREINEEHSH